MSNCETQFLASPKIRKMIMSCDALLYRSLCYAILMFAMEVSIVGKLNEKSMKHIKICLIGYLDTYSYVCSAAA